MDRDCSANGRVLPVIQMTLELAEEVSEDIVAMNILMMGSIRLIGWVSSVRESAVMPTE